MPQSEDAQIPADHELVNALPTAVALSADREGYITAATQSALLKTFGGGVVATAAPDLAETCEVPLLVHLHPNARVMWMRVPAKLAPQTKDLLAQRPPTSTLSTMRRGRPPNKID